MIIEYWTKRFLDYIQTLRFVSVYLCANNSIQKLSLSIFYTIPAFLFQKRAEMTWNIWRLRKHKRGKHSHSPIQCVPIGEWLRR